MYYRIQIIKSSILLEPSQILFDVQENGKISALRLVGAKLCGKPLSENDFRIEPLKYYWQTQDLYKVAHLRLPIEFEIKIEPL